MTNACIGYTVQIEAIQCNKEVAMETQGKTKFERQTKNNGQQTSMSNCKRKKQKHLESCTNLIECLENMGDSKKTMPKN